MAEFDITLGARIKEARRNILFSQPDLAKALGISFQQVQKYENGKNRVSVSRLVDICNALEVDISFFIGNDE